MNGASIPCPACGAPLFAARAPDATLLACKQCAGLWLDNGASQLAAEARLSEFALSVAQLLDRNTTGVAPNAAVARRPAAPYRAPPRAAPRACPFCGRPLTRRLYALARTELDVCDAHGTWFDRHELLAVVQAVALQKAAEAGARERQTTFDHLLDALDDAVNDTLWRR